MRKFIVWRVSKSEYGTGSWVIIDNMVFVRTAPQRCLRPVARLDQRGHGVVARVHDRRRDGHLGEQGTDCHRAARELTEDCMSRKAGKTQLELLTKVTKARLTARQAFMANMLGNVRQLLRDLPA